MRPIRLSIADGCSERFTHLTERARSRVFGAAALALICGLATSAHTADAPAPPAAPTARPTGDKASAPGAPAARAITLVAPSDSGALMVSANSSTLRYRVAVVVESIKPGTPLVAEAPPLLGPDGMTAEVTLVTAAKRGPSVTLEPKISGEVIDIDMLAALPRAGDYTGRLTLRYGDSPPLVTPFRITRSSKAASFDVIGTPRAASCWNCGRSVSLRLTLQSAVDGLQLTPTLVDLARTVKDQLAVQAYPSEAAFMVDGRPVKPPLMLAANTPRVVTLELSGLDSTGEFKGKARFTAPDSEPKDVEFTALVSDPMWFAALLIAGGAGVSMAIRRYIADRRPRSLVRERLARVARELEALREQLPALSPNAPEARVLGRFTQRLADLQAQALLADRVDEAWSKSAETTVQQIADKLNAFVDWTNCRREVEALGAAATPELREALRTIEIALLADAALGDADRKTLDGLPDKVEAVRRTAIESAIAALAQRASAHRARAHATLADSPAWQQLDQRIEAARKGVAASNFASAQQALDAANLVFGQLLIDDLLARIAQGKPAGVESAAWASIEPQLKQALEAARASASPAEVLAGYVAAYRRYLELLVDARAAQFEGEALDDLLERLPEAERAGYQARVKPLLQSLEAVRKQLADDKLSEAWDAFVAADTEAKALLTRALGGAQMSAQGAAPIEAALLAPSSPPVQRPTVLARPTLMLEDPAALSVERRRIERRIDYAALAVATALGVTFVWTPTWGGVNDWVAAVLWGLGLHQISGSTFDGVLGLRERLATK